AALVMPCDHDIVRTRSEIDGAASGASIALRNRGSAVDEDNRAIIRRNHCEGIGACRWCVELADPFGHCPVLYCLNCGWEEQVRVGVRSSEIKRDFSAGGRR